MKRIVKGDFVRPDMQLKAYVIKFRLSSWQKHNLKIVIVRIVEELLNCVAGTFIGELLRGQ